MYRLKIAALFMMGLVSLLVAGKEFTVPRPANAKTYPAHDEHRSELVTVAVDPYDGRNKADIFKVNWRDHGYLPVYFVVSNDSDQPIALTGLKIEWVTANRSKIMPATDEDLARRLSRVKHRGDEASRNPLPVPLPRKGPQVGISKEAREEIDAAQFRAMAVDPHATQAGFLFFDIEDIREPLAGAHVYVSGVKDGNGQELLYFEIPVDRYLSGPAAK